MARRIVFLLVALNACHTCLGQSAVRSYEPEKLAKQLTEFKQAVNSGAQNVFFSETHERVGNLAILGEVLGKQLHIGGTMAACDSISPLRVRLDGVHDAGLVRMQCGWDLNLVFSHRTQQGWLYLQTVALPNEHSEARISIASVTGDNSEQVLVHKVQYQSGTGINQQNFVIYKLKDGQLSPVFNEVESGWVTEPWTKDRASQESQFKFAPSEHDPRLGPDAAPTFEETQVLDFAGEQVELKRDHMWLRKEQVFLALQWYSVRPLKPATPKSPSR
jgi:hypothetical protein